MRHRNRSTLNQSGRAGKTELMILLLLAGTGVAFFVPRIHGGILGAVGKTLRVVLVFFLGLVLLIVVVGLLHWAWQSLGEWIVKLLKGKDPPKPTGKS